jgi:hypothetical protein
LVAAAATALVGCGSARESAVAPTTIARTSADGAEFYDRLALPAERPVGLSFARIEQFADPGRDGQRALLVFATPSETNTVYLCSRDKDEGSRTGTACPYPGKRVLRVVEGTETETVYALDTQDAQTAAKGGNAEGRRRIVDLLVDARTGWQVWPSCSCSPPE